MSTGIEDQTKTINFWQAYKPILIVGIILSLIVFGCFIVYFINKTEMFG